MESHDFHSNVLKLRLNKRIGIQPKARGERGERPYVTLTGTCGQIGYGCQGDLSWAIVLVLELWNVAFYRAWPTGQLLVGFLHGVPLTLIITAYCTTKNDKQVSGNRKTLSLCIRESEVAIPTNLRQKQRKRREFLRCCRSTFLIHYLITSDYFKYVTLFILVFW